MSRVNFDLVILGAGSAGLAVADVAASHGFSCMVYECAPAEGFSSLRNQGWIHSGALYAARDQPSTAKKCRAGWNSFRELRDQLGLGTLSNKPALMIFREIEKLDSAHEKIRNCELSAERVEGSRLGSLEPVLGDEPQFVGGLLIQDVAMDTAAILNALMKRAKTNGCVFRLLADRKFQRLGIRRRGSVWTLRPPLGEEVKASHIVLTCGTLIPAMVGRICRRKHEGGISKCAVLALNCAATNRILIMNDSSTVYMNIAPFVGGVTVNLGDSVKETRYCDDNLMPPEYKDVIFRMLQVYAPGLLRMLPTTGRIYTCQKLNPEPHSEAFKKGGRDYFTKEVAHNVHVLYPGKFTESVIAARAFVEELKDKLQFSDRFPSQFIDCDTWEYTHPGLSPPEFFVQEERGKINVTSG